MTPGQGFNFLTGPKDFTWGPWKPETLEGSPIGDRRIGNSQWEKPSSSSPLVNINWRNNNSVFRTESLHLKWVWIPVLDFSVVWESQAEKIICLKPEKPRGLPAVANSNHHEDGGSFPCVMHHFFLNHELIFFRNCLYYKNFIFFGCGRALMLLFFINQPIASLTSE